MNELTYVRNSAISYGFFYYHIHICKAHSVSNDSEAPAVDCIGNSIKQQQ